jgi:hypothetical protein
MQFSIVSLLGLITVAAILLMIVKQGAALYEYFRQRGLMPSEVLEEGDIAARVAGIPILFALACTIHTVGWLAISLAARSASALRSVITCPAKR